MIDKQTIEERKQTITKDILTVKERLSEYEAKKVEDVALINALTGALQQCDEFLKEIDNVEPDASDSSDVE